MLFSFNDEFIAATCGGLNDADTLDLFMAGYQAAADTLESSVKLTTGRAHKADLDLAEEIISFELTAEEQATEYGDADTSMQPRLRQGLAGASQHAARAFSKVVNDRG